VNQLLFRLAGILGLTGTREDSPMFRALLKGLLTLLLQVAVVVVLAVLVGATWMVYRFLTHPPVL
jgi:hypothetical protein